MLTGNALFQAQNREDQLRKVCTACGIPSHIHNDFQDLSPDQRWNRIMKFSLSGSSDFSACKLRHALQNVHPLAIDLLSKMLVIDPGKRITAFEAQSHPFFTKIHTKWHKMGEIRKFDFSFEKVFYKQNHHERVISAHQLRNLFLYEVSKYRKVQCHFKIPLHLHKAKTTPNHKAAAPKISRQIEPPQSPRPQVAIDTIRVSSSPKLRPPRCHSDDVPPPGSLSDLDIEFMLKGAYPYSKRHHSPQNISKRAPFENFKRSLSCRLNRKKIENKLHTNTCSNTHLTHTIFSFEE
jgi:serine/threonine protein kinase